MKKLLSIATAVAIAPVLFASTPVFANSPGQLSNAPTNYEVKNITKSGAYAQSASAACGESVRYSVLIANSDFGLLKDVNVKTGLNTGETKVSATNAVNQNTSVSGKVLVNTTGALNYVAGSSVRIATDGTRTKLQDSITANGVNAGDLNGSTQTFVQFDAKVTCDTPPKVPGKINVCELATNKVISIDEKDFNSTKHSRDLSKCDVTPVVTPTDAPTELVAAGAGEVVAIFAAAAAFGAVVYNFVLRRQNAR